MTAPSASRAFRWAAAGLLVLALVIRVGVVLTDDDYAPVRDPADYDRHARSIAGGDGYPESNVAPAGGPAAGRPPVYPYLLGALYVLPGDDLRNARLAQAGIGVATVALLGLLAFQLAGPVAALAALALGALFPPLILVGASLLSESVHVPLSLAALSAALAQRRSTRSLRWPLAAGLLLGMATLARTNAIVMLPFLAYGVWSAGPRNGRTAFLQPAALAAAAVVTILPWSVRNTLVFDDLVPLTTQTGFVMAGTYNDLSKEDRVYPAAWRPPLTDPDYARILRDPSAREDDVEREWRAEAFEEIRGDPWYVAETVFWNSVRFLHIAQRGYAHAEDVGVDPWLIDAGVYGFVATAALALAGLFTSAARRAPPWFWLSGIAVWILTVALAGFIRYRSAVDPFFILLASFAVASAWDRAAARSGEPRAARQ